MPSEIADLSSSQAPDVERALDRAIEALTSMNVETLLQLVSLCQEYEEMRGRLSFTDLTCARLSRKLLLFNRLLRQTRINLNILGLEPARHVVTDGYRTLGWH